MSEADYMQTRTEGEAAGEQVTAIYHSHVEAGPGVYLSETDLEYARHALFPFPEADQIVVAVSSREQRPIATLSEDGCVEGLGIFAWDAASSCFRGRRVRPEAP